MDLAEPGLHVEQGLLPSCVIDYFFNSMLKRVLLQCLPTLRLLSWSISASAIFDCSGLTPTKLATQP